MIGSSGPAGVQGDTGLDGPKGATGPPVKLLVFLFFGLFVSRAYRRYNSEISHRNQP